MGARIFTFPCRPDRLWGPPSLPSNGYRVYCGRGREADHSPPTSVNKMWIYTSTIPYAFMVQCLIGYAQGQLYLLPFKNHQICGSEIQMLRCIYMHLCYLQRYSVMVHSSCLGSISVIPIYIPALVYVLYFGSQDRLCGLVVRVPGYRS
jgi:hypothetical protein